MNDKENQKASNDICASQKSGDLLMKSADLLSIIDDSATIDEDNHASTRISIESPISKNNSGDALYEELESRSRS